MKIYSFIFYYLIIFYILIVKFSCYATIKKFYTVRIKLKEFLAINPMLNYRVTIIRTTVLYLNNLNDPS